MENISYYVGHFEKCKYLKLPKGEISASCRILSQGPQGYIICREKILLLALFVRAKISTLAARLSDEILKPLFGLPIQIMEGRVKILEKMPKI